MIHHKTAPLGGFFYAKINSESQTLNESEFSMEKFIHPMGGAVKPGLIEIWRDAQHLEISRFHYDELRESVHRGVSIFKTVAWAIETCKERFTTLCLWQRIDTDEESEFVKAYRDLHFNTEYFGEVTVHEHYGFSVDSSFDDIHSRYYILDLLWQHEGQVLLRKININNNPAH
ncbi:MAG: hypothetical protein M3Q80_01515 [bacterium]|nr:hypothetical protein [bacterium]